MSLLFLYLVAICVAHSFLLLAYRLLRFFIAFFLNLPKSVSLGLSVAYPRTDYCPLSIPRCLGLLSALLPYTFNG